MAIAVSSSGTFPNANFTTSPAYTATFIPQLWAGKLNVKFYATTVFGEICNTSYEGDIKSMGDKVTINNIPSITISDYTVGTALSYEVPAPSIVELTIDKAKYFGVNVSDVLAYQSQPKLMDMFTNDASKQMAITIDRTVLLGVFDQGAAANKGATAGAISGAYSLGTDAAPLVLTVNNVVQVFTALASVLDEQNVPDTDRWIVITPYVRNLLMSSSLAQAYVTGDNQSILRNGKIGTIDRFTIYVSHNLKVTSSTKYHIIAGTKMGLTFASQMTEMETIRSETTFGDIIRGLQVYGYKVVKPEALVESVVSFS